MTRLSLFPVPLHPSPFPVPLHPSPFPDLLTSPVPFSSLFLDNIFYVMEYRELFLTLFRKFNERHQPRSFLRDLVETTHLFLKMLERFCQSRGNLLVQVWKELCRKGRTADSPTWSVA